MTQIVDATCSGFLLLSKSGLSSSLGWWLGCFGGAYSYLVGLGGVGDAVWWRRDSVEGPLAFSGAEKAGGSRILEGGFSFRF